MVHVCLCEGFFFKFIIFSYAYKHFNNIIQVCVKVGKGSTTIFTHCDIPIDVSLHFEESNHQTNNRWFSRTFCFESDLKYCIMYFCRVHGCTLFHGLVASRLHWRGTAWIADFLHSSELNAKRSVTSVTRTNDTQISSPCYVVVLTLLQNYSLG